MYKNSRLFINIPLFPSSHLIRCITTQKINTRTHTYTHKHTRARALHLCCNLKDLSFDHTEQDVYSKEEALTLAGYCCRTDELYGQDSTNQKKLSRTAAFRRDRSALDTRRTLRRSVIAGSHPAHPRVVPTWSSVAIIADAVWSKYRRAHHDYNWSLFKILDQAASRERNVTVHYLVDPLRVILQSLRDQGFERQNNLTQSHNPDGTDTGLHHGERECFRCHNWCLCELSQRCRAHENEPVTPYG